MRIFITGGTGFIGRHLINDLEKSNNEIFVLSRKLDQTLPPHINIVNGNLFELSKLSVLLNSIDVVIHIAGEKRNEQQMYNVNVEGTRSLIDSLKQNRNVKFIHISSAGIYGIEAQKNNVISENSEKFPNNNYEHSKLKAENITQELCKLYTIPYIILRPTNVIGENDPEKKLLNLAKSLKAGNFFMLNCNAMVNYVYVKKLSSIINEIIERRLYDNQMYNVNEPIQIDTFINYFKSSLNITKKTKIIPVFLHKFIKLYANYSDFLPKKLRFINKGKYRELTSEKYYSINKLESTFSSNNKMNLSNAINNLINHYKEEKLL